MFKARLAFLPLALALGLAGTAGAQDVTDMTQAERQAFRDEVRAYLLENPEVLMEAIGILEQRQAQAQQGADADLIAAHSEALFSDPDSHVAGNPEGDVTVVEFLDYRCGYCRRAHPEVAELLASDGDIRLVIKEFPILGEDSVLASRFALAVRAIEGDEAYAAVHERLMTDRAAPTQESLEALAGEMGLDMAAVSAKMTDPEIDAIIARNRALGQALQINGTPSFVFGDQMVRGYVPLDAMRAIVEEERAG